MTLDLEDCILSGSAMTTPFLRDGLVLPFGIETNWDALRKSLRGGGAERVHRHVTSKLASALGYDRPRRQDPVTTREGACPQLGLHRRRPGAPDGVEPLSG